MRLLIVLVLSSLAVHASAAPINWGDLSGVNVDFNQITDSTLTMGDPDGLFGTPQVLGDSLFFFPTNFSASAADGSADVTAAALQTMIVAKPGTLIDTLLLSEFGDADLAGSGMAATSVSVEREVTVTILSTLSGMNLGQVIQFLAAPFAEFELPGDSGLQVWNGQLLVDIGSVVPDATSVMFQLTNTLDATSESGTTAFVQKKVAQVPGVRISLPEPNLAWLALGALFGVRLTGRRRR